MSAQSKAKESQGYVPKAVPSVCSNCRYFQADYVDVNEKFHKGDATSLIRPFFEHRNMRCGIGGFAIKKMGVCNSWIKKEPA